MDRSSNINTSYFRGGWHALDHRLEKPQARGIQHWSHGHRLEGLPASIGRCHAVIPQSRFRARGAASVLPSIRRSGLEPFPHTRSTVAALPILTEHLWFTGVSLHAERISCVFRSTSSSESAKTRGDVEIKREVARRSIHLGAGTGIRAKVEKNSHQEPGPAKLRDCIARCAKSSGEGHMRSVAKDARSGRGEASLNTDQSRIAIVAGISRRRRLAILPNRGMTTATPIMARDSIRHLRKSQVYGKTSTIRLREGHGLASSKNLKARKRFPARARRTGSADTEKCHVGL